jgi:hypothetical protein
MTTRKLELLPFVCDKVAVGEYTRNTLIRLMRHCKPEFHYLRESRQKLHARWQTLPFTRGARNEINAVIEWSDAEVAFIDLAIRHIGEWIEQPCPEQLNQARSRLQMSEQAHRQYLRSRLEMEPQLVEKMYRQANPKRRKPQPEPAASNGSTPAIKRISPTV